MRQRKSIPREIASAEVHYDDSRKPCSSALEAMARYDPQVFPRWNRETARWEIWRRRDGLSSTGVISRGEGALFCFTVRVPDWEPDAGAFLELTAPVITAMLKRGDSWTRYGAIKTDSDCKRVDGMMKKEEDADHAHSEQKFDEFHRDFVADHRRELSNYFNAGPIAFFPQFNPEKK